MNLTTVVSDSMPDGDILRKLLVWSGQLHLFQDFEDHFTLQLRREESALIGQDAVAVDVPSNRGIITQEGMIVSCQCFSCFRNETVDRVIAVLQSD